MTGFTARPQQPARASRVTLITMLVLSVIHLLLTADHDILALNQPYDDYWFVSSAYRRIWGGAYDQLSFAQLQTYSIYLKIQALLGVPARLGIDCLWLFACTYLALATNRFCGRNWPGLIVFVFLSFHPYALTNFDRALSENLTVATTAVALAGLLDVWNFRATGSNPRQHQKKMFLSSVVGGLAFAIAFHSRKEGLLLIMPLAFVATLTLLHRSLWWTARGGYLGGLLLLTPVLATVLLGLALAGANYVRWGIFARYELASPSYLHAVGMLNAIEPQRATQKWVAVDEDTRSRAYAVSPTFKELQVVLEGPIKQHVLNEQLRYGGAKGDIGNGWFYWMLREAAAQTGWHRNPLSAEQHYAKISSEIQAAFDAGTLRRRNTFLSFIDPDWRKWLPDLPEALAKQFGQLLTPRARDLVLPNEDATSGQEEIYVRIAGRRNMFRRIDIEGWLVIAPGSTIALGNATAIQPRVILDGPARPDVPGALPFHVVGFSNVGVDSLHIRALDGAIAVVPLSGLAEGKMQSVSAIANAVIGIDNYSVTEAPKWSVNLIEALCTASSVLGWVFLFSGIASVLLVGINEPVEENAARLVLCSLFVALASRVGLLALLDSSSWQGSQSRYMLPAIPIFAVFGAVGLWKISERIRMSRRALSMHAYGRDS